MTPLDQVRKTTRQRSQAQTAWERALRDARESGATLEAIASEAGLTRQRVWQILNGANHGRKAEPSEAQIEARLAELDARWNKLVDRIAGSYTPDKAITAMRNAQAGKLARKGLPPRPTQKLEARRLAEAQILSVLKHRGDHVIVGRIQAELDEAWNLRQRLADLRDSRAGF